MQIMDLKIEIIPEIDLESNQIKSIAYLLEACFELYPSGQAYVNQIPHVRILGYQNKQLISHAALHFRKIIIDSFSTRVIGIGDFCVHPNYRSEGYGSRLMDEIILLSNKMPAISHILCFSTDHNFYLKKGFKIQSGVFKWMLSSQQGTLGIAHRRLNNELMMYSLDGQYFTHDCTIDLQGPPF
jgi:GNAT superfamily N-acetyltransferase